MLSLIKCLALSQVSDLFDSCNIGLDIIPLTLDWSQITGYLSSPLMTPFWAIANVFVGFVFWIWFLTPILHFTNVWYGKYMPISTSVSYDNTGRKYNFTNILNDQFEFDLAKYKTTLLYSSGLRLLCRMDYRLRLSPPFSCMCVSSKACISGVNSESPRLQKTTFT
jgi:hypothetical protein